MRLYSWDPVTLGLLGQPFGEGGYLIAGPADEMYGATPRHPKAPYFPSPRSFLGHSQILIFVPTFK